MRVGTIAVVLFVFVLRLPGVLSAVDTSDYPPQCGVYRENIDTTFNKEYIYKNTEAYTNKCWKISCESGVLLLSGSFYKLSGTMIELYTTDKQDASSNFTKFMEVSSSLFRVPFSGPVIVNFVSDYTSTHPHGFELRFECEASNKPPSRTTSPSVAGALFPSFCAGQRTMLPGSGAVEWADYRSSQDVCWLIMCKTNIVLTWQHFSTETSRDTVEYFALSPSFEATRVKVQAGYVSTPMTEAYSGNMLLRFAPARHYYSRGFAFEYICTEPTDTPSTAPDTQLPATHVPEVPPGGRVLVFPSFCAEQTELFATSHEVAYPGSREESYLRYEKRCWMLRCDGGELLLSWEYLHLHPSDFLEFYAETDGVFSLTENKTVLVNAFTSSHSGVLLLRLRSDASYESSGFKFQYTCTKLPAPTIAPVAETETPTIVPHVSAEGFPQVCRNASSFLLPTSEPLWLDDTLPDQNICWKVSCADGTDSVSVEGYINLRVTTSLTWYVPTDTGYERVFVATGDIPSLDLSYPGDVVMQLTSDGSPGAGPGKGMRLDFFCLGAQPTEVPTTVAPAVSERPTTTFVPILPMDSSAPSRTPEVSVDVGGGSSFSTEGAVVVGASSLAAFILLGVCVLLWGRFSKPWHSAPSSLRQKEVDPHEPCQRAAVEPSMTETA